MGPQPNKSRAPPIKNGYAPPISVQRAPPIEKLDMPVLAPPNVPDQHTNIRSDSSPDSDGCWPPEGSRQPQLPKFTRCSSSGKMPEQRAAETHNTFPYSKNRDFADNGRHGKQSVARGESQTFARENDEVVKPSATRNQFEKPSVGGGSFGKQPDHWEWPPWCLIVKDPCIEVFVEDEDTGDSRWVRAEPQNRVVDPHGNDTFLCAEYEWDGEYYNQDFGPQHVRRRGAKYTVKELVSKNNILGATDRPGRSIRPFDNGGGVTALLDDT